ncbi:MAG: hypothetical protein M3O23_13105 [Actinomycetota bacterium]|nr:hypothetical protein [Actinomycetota bacterium]
MVLAFVVAIVGVAVALAGALTTTYLLIPLGFALIVGAVLSFVRTRQDSPVVTKE